jgi:DNA invertase Pin-like site-specific DNA recombinase
LVDPSGFEIGRYVHHMRIGYARVSTGEQKLVLQKDALDEAGCERIYEEKTSGSSKSRPELERCLDSLREGDTLVVWRLDRFGRSLKDLVQKMDSLEEKGVDFVSLTEGIDTTTAQGKLTFHIFGALAEFERELARERTMAGLRAARERGRVGGRPRALDEEEIPQVQALMKKDDVSTADICERFGISKATLYRYVGPDGKRRR